MVAKSAKPHYLLSTIHHSRFSTRSHAAALVALTVIIYLPSLRSGWIWDDDYYVTRNASLRSLDGLRNIWFKIGATPQYYPATHTTFWIERQVWGLWPAGFHAVNVLLHAASAAMIWRILKRLDVPGAWLAAAIFALHPVQVESVAWITERKNVLSGVFYFAAMLAYLKSGVGFRVSGLGEENAEASSSSPETRNPQPETSMYFLSLALFTLAILSKSVAASLPAAILLIAWWKRGRLTWRNVRPLAPFFLLAIAMGTLTGWMERTVVGARGPEFDFSLAQRVLIAGRAAWFYAWSLAWPVKLTFIYPRWSVDASIAWQWVFPLSAAGLVIGLWLMRRRIGRGPAAAVLFFGGTLFPALGFINVYPMRYSFVADHFQYLACSGLIVLAAARLRRMHFIVPVILLAILGALTWRQQSAYVDLKSLWTDTLKKNPDAWIAHNNLGNVLLGENDFAGAETHFLAALALKQDVAKTMTNLGALEEKRGKMGEAMAWYARAVEADAMYPGAQMNLGRALMARGQVDEAIAHLEQAAAVDARQPQAHRELALAYLGRGQLDDAQAQALLAIEQDPESALAMNTLGMISAARRQYPVAAAQFRRAVALDPLLAEAHNNLGAALELTGDAAGALRAYENAVKARPDFQPARRNLQRLRPAP